MIYTQVETPRGSFGVRRSGHSGRLVVCMHGFPDDASTYDALADELIGAGHRVAAINLRGYVRQLWMSRFDHRSGCGNSHGGQAATR